MAMEEFLEEQQEEGEFIIIEWKWNEWKAKLRERVKVFNFIKCHKTWNDENWKRKIKFSPSLPSTKATTLSYHHHQEQQRQQQQQQCLL